MKNLHIVLCILLILKIENMSYNLYNRIILIDDSPAEPILLESAITASQLNIRLECFDDSIAAVKELQKRSEEKSELLPSLILLDLNMPGYNGVQVLKIFRNDPFLKYIPIIIMTSSSLDADMKDCLDAGACSVLVKPTGHKQYTQVVTNIFNYWFQTVKRTNYGFF
jgi:chemotaxis family two-component system response regulator Rcp1